MQKVQKFVIWVTLAAVLSLNKDTMHVYNNLSLLPLGDIHLHSSFIHYL